MANDLTPGDSGELVERPDGGLPSARAELPSADYMEDEGGPQLQRYIAAVLRYKWWIVAATLLGAAVGLGLARFVAPVYEARTTVWIETSSPQADRTGPIRPDELLESSSWVELLKSAMVLEPVVRDLDLFVRPGEPEDTTLLSGLEFQDRFAPGSYRLRANGQSRSYVLETASGNVVERGSFGDSVGSAIGLQWVPELRSFPEDRAVEFALRSPREMATNLASRLEASMDRNGNFLQISLQGENPQQLTNTLNSVGDQYVSVAADLKRARLDELTEILEQQLDYAAERLQRAEAALEDFRVQTVTLPSDRSTPVAPGLEITRDPVFSSFFDMRIELENVRRQQDLIRQAISPDSDVKLETLRAVEAVQGSAEMTAALNELTEMRSELRALRYRYTDQHPPVRQLLDEIEVLETETLPGLARGVLSRLDAQERQLEQRIANASDELEEIPPRTIEEARLTRTVESADNLYTTLLRRFEEARLAAASSIPDVRVLDEATVPREPVQNQAPQLILLAMLGGLGLGLAGAILRDRFDPRFRYPDQVTGELGLNILAGIPRVREGGWLRQDNRSQAQEAFRSLRLNVMHAYGSAGPVTLTISSPGPGDGKSFVSANLGRAFANIGKKTLLIDGDTRRGQLHEILGRQRKPGLINLLKNPNAGRNGPPIRTTDHDQLYLLSSGSRAEDGPELLSSRRMRDLVLRLRSEFDVIIIDSPPLGAGVDPFVLGTLTGAMLMVLRTGETDRQLADAKLDLLDRLPIRVLGAVMNGVPDSREYRYYSYSAGYESWDEETTPAPPLLEEELASGSSTE